MNKFMNLFARIISNVFLPPFSIFYAGVLLLLKFALPLSDVKIALTIIFIFGVLLPVAVFVILIKLKKISDQDAKQRTERGLPYAFGLLFTIIGTFILYLIAVPGELRCLWLITSVSSASIMIINHFWKISAHLMASALSATVLAIFGVLPVSIAAIIIVAIAWSRVWLKCHTLAQVIAGGIYGVSVALLISRLYC